jgi:transposase
MAELVVAAVVFEGRSKSAVARDYGISRRWVITLVQRYLDEGDAGLVPRSRRPHRSPNQTPAEIENEIIAIRKRLDRAGHEAGAATITAHLERRHGHSPAVSTIWRILTDRGFVTPQPHKWPKSSYIRFEAAMPNELWQTDITHWALANGTDVEISTSSMTTRGYASPVSAGRCSKPPTSTPASVTRPLPGVIPPECSPTTAPSTRAATAASAGSL